MQMSKVHTDPGNQEIILSLKKMGAEFIVVGGLAVAFYGCRDEIRVEEIDIVINPTISNATKIISLAIDFGYQPRIHPQDLAGPKKQMPLKNWHHQIDVLTPSEDIIFEHLMSRSNEFFLGDTSVNVIGLNDLIAMKQIAADHSDDPKHKVDLERLNRLES
jgi:predicted nucleotidyltransferase